MNEDVKHVALDFDDLELARGLGTNSDMVAKNRAGFDLVRQVAQRIRNARQGKGWTQKQLAERLGVTVGRVSQYETGDLRHAPSLRVLAEIAHALEMTVDVLILAKVSEASDLWEDSTAERLEGGFVAPAGHAGDVSVGQAASMNPLSLADELKATTLKLVKEHPEMGGLPLLSDSVRSAIVDNNG